jgi:hypothetical protein
LAVTGAAFYAIAGWSGITHALAGDPRPPSMVGASSVTGSEVMVTIRILGSADTVDVHCIPKKGVSPGVVEASPDDALTDSHALCSDEAETPFYVR